MAQGVGGEDPVGYARDDVKNSPHAGEWMELFGKAVALYRGEPAGGDADAKRRDEQLKQLQAGTTGDAAVGIAKEFLGAEGGLILDVKSTYSTPADIAAFVKFLKGQGINVFGVGTFKPEQLAALGDDTRKVTFFHGINDMESKVAARSKPGADVMFNGGSLLNGGPEYLVAGREVYEINQGAYQRLVALQRRLALNIGLYVQESAVSPDAVQKITELVNRNPSVFTRGFAYGNVSGSAEERDDGHRHGRAEVDGLVAEALGARRATAEQDLRDALRLDASRLVASEVEARLRARPNFLAAFPASALVQLRAELDAAGPRLADEAWTKLTDLRAWFGAEGGTDADEAAARRAGAGAVRRSRAGAAARVRLPR